MSVVVGDCPVIFILGVEGSGTTLLQNIFDMTDWAASIGGNVFSKNYEKAGGRACELTTALWKVRVSPDKKKIINDINNIQVPELRPLVFKRSYPFIDDYHMPDVRDMLNIGSSQQFVVMKRNFHDNVRSIRRRNFEPDQKLAISRIASGYIAYSEILFFLESSGISSLVLNYDLLVNTKTKQSEIFKILDYFSLEPELASIISSFIRS